MPQKCISQSLLILLVRTQYFRKIWVPIQKHAKVESLLVNTKQTTCRISLKDVKHDEIPSVCVISKVRVEHVKKNPHVICKILVKQGFSKLWKMNFRISNKYKGKTCLMNCGSILMDVELTFVLYFEKYYQFSHIIQHLHVYFCQLSKNYFCKNLNLNMSAKNLIWFSFSALQSILQNMIWPF